MESGTTKIAKYKWMCTFPFVKKKKKQTLPANILALIVWLKFFCNYQYHKTN